MSSRLWRRRGWKRSPWLPSTGIKWVPFSGSWRGIIKGPLLWRRLITLFLSTRRASGTRAFWRLLQKVWFPRPQSFSASRINAFTLLKMKPWWTTCFVTGHEERAIVHVTGTSPYASEVWTLESSIGQISIFCNNVIYGGFWQVTNQNLPPQCFLITLFNNVFINQPIYLILLFYQWRKLLIRLKLFKKPR